MRKLNKSVDHQNKVGRSISYQGEQRQLTHMNTFMQEYDPEAYREHQANEKLRKYDQIYDKLSLLNPKVYKYSNETLMPYLFFYKYMAKRAYDDSNKSSKLKLWIPDTIVLNDRDLPAMWFYTSSDGYVYRTDSFTVRNAIQKFKDGVSEDNELVGVVKKPQFRNMELVGNDPKVFLSHEVPLLFQNLMSAKGETTVIQKYIKCKGPNAYICRTIWRRKGNSIAWIITSKIGYQEEGDMASRCIASASKRFTCNITPCIGGRFLQDTMPYLMNLLQYMRRTFAVEFDELGCDFTKGIDNKWYMLNVRGFQISNCTMPLYIKHITHDEPNIQQDVTVLNPWAHTKIKNCKFCQLTFAKHQLTHKLTLKMLMEIDLHLINRNIQFPWIQSRVIHNHIDIAMLFSEHPVCLSCFELYKACEALVNVEFQLAQKLRIPVKEKNNLVSISQQDYRVKGQNVANIQNANTISGNAENFQMPPDWELQVAAGSEIETGTNQPQAEKTTIKCLKRYRVLIYFKVISEIPLEAQFSGCSYSICYSFLRENIKFALSLKQVYETAKGVILNVGYAKVFHVFATDQSKVESILNPIVFELLRNNEKIGEFQCEMSDFKNESVVLQDYCKYFNGAQIKQIMSWCCGLNIGLIESAYSKINIERIKLRKYEQVYLPDPTYYCCEPLPDEWMGIFNKSKDFKHQNYSFGMSDVSNLFDNSRIQNYHQSITDQQHFKGTANSYIMQELLHDEIQNYEIETANINPKIK